MNKVELVEGIAKASKLTKTAAATVLEATLATITKALKAGDTVTLIGFGTFKVTQRAARSGRNPKTGATIKIKARKAPSFKAGGALKDAVNGNKK